MFSDNLSNLEHKIALYSNRYIYAFVVHQSIGTNSNMVRQNQKLTIQDGGLHSSTLL